MKKFLKSFWLRMLTPVVCTISGLGLIVSIFSMVFFAEMGGTEEIYQNVYGEIADGYAMYAVDKLEAGDTTALAEYLSERGISCSIWKKVGGSGVETLEFSTGELRENKTYERDLTVGGYRQYNTSSLVAVLFGYNYGATSIHTVQAPVLGYVFDKETGLFYYETDKYYFPVNYVIVEQDGAKIDFSFTEVNGVECYYNGYYDIRLDTSQYESWGNIEIDGCKVHFVELESILGMIHVVTTADIMQKGIGGVVVDSDYNYVEYYPKGEVDTYVVQLDWDYEKGKECLFDEWEYLYKDIVQFEKWLIPLTVFSFVLFAMGMVLLVYSANNDKEKMGIFHKTPVVTFSFAVVLGEFALLTLLTNGLAGMLVSYGAGSVNVGITLALLIIGLILWFAFVWLQSMITRLKCKSFWKTTELYYLYLLIKRGWSFITRPFRAVAKACKNVLQILGQNIPLFWGGIAIFVVLSFVEYFLAISRYEDIYAFLYLLLKIVEVVALVVVLRQAQLLHDGSKRIAAGDVSNPIDTSKMLWKFREHGENINKVSDGITVAVNERMKSEHFKTELITNVSHDIKTPLTSIINYVDLIKKEDVQDEKLKEYIDVLDRQSARLKKLIEDLMEASKASTGNLAVSLEECDIDVLLTQVIGEFEEKLEKNQLQVMIDKPDHPVKMMADGRHMWRVLDNLLNNACKYSLPGTRVYVSLKQEGKEASLVFKNISKTALNIPSEELMERFVRGDSSRNTEGSGLGLSIAQSLTELMGGKLQLEIDGDLFKVTLRFPLINE